MEPQGQASTTLVATEEPIEYGPPAPAGLIDVLYEGVEGGSWTYEQGLVDTLKLFTGETRVGQFAAGQQPSSTEGSGIVREAQLYLKSGQDAGARAEIERLLGVIAPAPERLLEVADPEPVTGARLPGYAARSKISEDCDALYKDGFPSGSGLKCLLYKEGGISGQLIRIFYPLLDMPLDYADAAYTGVMQSFEAYSKLAPKDQSPQMKGVDLLFVVLPEIEDPSTLAMVPTTGGDDRCLIVVYLGAIQENETKKGGPDDFGHFLQTVAHEMFHCFQTWNFPAQADASWKVQDWWGEGTAEFFSNVVYPDVNGEWEWTGTFSYNSAEKPLTEMGYENFAFFQYLDGEQGHTGVLNLISAMPALGGEKEQAAALSKLPGMQETFHAFGQAFLDGQVLDSSGALIPSKPAYVPADHVITVKEAQIRLLEAESFVLERYGLVFPQGYRYEISQADKGAPASHSARIDLASSPWGDLPAQAFTACSPVTYLYLLTTAQSDAGKASVELNMVPQEELACDECLVGTWDLDVPSYVDYLTSLIPTDESNQFNVDFAGGVWQIDFSKQAVFTGTYNFVTLYSIYQVNAPLGNNILTEVKFTVEGDISALYFTDGVGHMQTSLLQDNLSFEQQVFMNGDEIPMGEPIMAGLFDLSGGSSSNITYSCDEDTLYLNFAPETVLTPLKYNRDQ